MKKIILSVAVISFALLSCKKSDKSCDLSTAAFAGTYKVTSVMYKADATTPEIDEYATWSACEKDDRVTFNANGTSSFDDLGTVCVPDGSYTGTWSLTGNSITVDGAPGTVIYFDCNSAAISFIGTAVGEKSTVSLARQ